MLAKRGVPARVARLVRATIHDAIDHDLSGEAAKMAYYFFLSLFPLVLVVFSITGIVGGNEAFTRITQALETSVPQHAWQFVRELVGEVRDQRRPGILSIGIVLMAWAGSNGIAALIRGLNAVYAVREERRWWHRRLIALAVLVVGVILIVLAATAFVPGLELLRRGGLAGVWRVARWPFAFALLTGAIWLAYNYLPARDQHHARAESLVGAIVAMILWLGVTWMFRLYVANFGRYGRVYGAVGAVIVLLIWFYITALAVLAGGELAAQLERQRAAARGSARNRKRAAPLPSA